MQRISQTIHPVGRGKKKALLAHIIQQHNWSQVLVFTRTKFGANNVAEFLTKNGIHAMALHGNKSQAARTQALGGFKSGDIRALVATDIAARGIDIDELPHVVNFDIPNVSEDYVHRIGRTGRAGSDGAAVSLVCLDEEGFMQDIERYTKQTIEVQLVDGFGPEPGERAEPIAMGRQTIWGGAGKPPSRDVMMAAPTAWEATVAHAAPAAPNGSETQSKKSPSRLTTEAAAMVSSGSRGALAARNAACATEVTNPKGMPSARMRLYATAGRSRSGVAVAPAYPTMSCGARSSSTAPSASPHPAAITSASPSADCAAGVSPLARARATRLVVAIARKVKP